MSEAFDGSGPAITRHQLEMLQLLLLQLFACLRLIQPHCIPNSMQIVLGYLTDSRSVAAARLACKSWRQAAAAAPCAVRVVLPSGAPNMRDKLAMLLRVSWLPACSICDFDLQPDRCPHCSTGARMSIRAYSILAQQCCVAGTQLCHAIETCAVLRGHSSVMQ
jgi:hypothetical protein